MTLWLSNDDVFKVLDMQTCLRLLEDAYRALSCGEAAERVPSRATTYKPISPDRFFQFRTIEGGVENYWGIRIFPQVLEYPEINGIRRRVTKAAADGLYCGFVLIFDTRTADMVAGMHDGYINWLATGGTAGLGMKYQIRAGAKVAAMIGAGWFGRAVFWATYLAHPFEQSRVYAPTRAHAEAFAREMNEKLGVAVAVVGSAEDAVRGADIVMCATNTSRPVIDGKWLEAGASVVSIVGDTLRLRLGQEREWTYLEVRREIDEETIRRAGTIMATSKAQAEWDEQGELYQLIKQQRLADWDKVVDLADVVAGETRGRRDDSEITLFKQNTGMGLWYAALGAYAYQEAKQKGLGENVSRDLFLETLRP